jgi:hypothetical protein
MSGNGGAGGGANNNPKFFEPRPESPLKRSRRSRNLVGLGAANNRNMRARLAALRKPAAVAAAGGGAPLPVGRGRADAVGEFNNVADLLQNLTLSPADGGGGGGGGGGAGGAGGGPPHPDNLKFVRNFSARLKAFEDAQPDAQRGTKRRLNGKKRSRKTRKYRKNRNSRTRKH